MVMQIGESAAMHSIINGNLNKRSLLHYTKELQKKGLSSHVFQRLKM